MRRMRLSCQRPQCVGVRPGNVVALSPMAGHVRPDTKVWCPAICAAVREFTVRQGLGALANRYTTYIEIGLDIGDAITER